MSDKHNIRVGITQGDINGIGYEIIFKTFANPEMFDICTPVIYGSPKLAAYHRKALELDVPYNAVETTEEIQDGKLNIINCNSDDVHIELGCATKESGEAAYQALERAVKDYQEGVTDLLVTAPINKNSIQNEDFHFPGHTEYLQERLGNGEKSLMILCSGDLRFAIATSHLALRDVPAAITPELIEEKLNIFNKSLKEDFNIDAPRIAVLSLNPHSGDNGLLGKEEIEIIIPTIEKMSKEGVLCYGPFGVDGFMGSGKYTHFDGILAMYHDQGLTPMKLLAMSNGVNFTAGLEAVRTSPAHGVAYDIAGKGCADENSFRQAIYTAIDIYRNRERYHAARRRPLRKLYFEKRDDSNRLNLQQEEKED
ncbi:MAG: 4-hydroxythreonine-4-phosphate dehydrogenase PdxA [Bacteroidaceae bacterium]|nr:4-hydroxythreonine-4-phosphate dehydrogenase PdxA [Bacteroidaceae bacterium]